MTGFKGVHPITSFLFFVLVFVISLASSHPIILSLSFVCALIYEIKLSGKSAVKSFFVFVLPMIFLITAVNASFCHYGVTVLFVMKSGNNFTLEAILYGLVFGAKTACALMWLNCFNEIITSEKLIFLFGRFSPKLALVLSMVLRFIPLLKEESKQIELARTGIGIDTKNAKPVQKLKNSVHSLSILITRVLECAAVTADSMSARGYAVGKRTAYNNFVFTLRDAVLLVLNAAAAVLIFTAKQSFYAVFNPVVEIAEPSFYSVFLSLCFALFCLEGLIVDLREDRLWSK